MKRMIVILAAALAAGFYLGTPAEATTGHGPSFETCGNLKNQWDVNPDEGDRKPTATVAGLKFEGNDLIHHTAEVALADLKGGSYAVASGFSAPDQPTFFSVEVRDPETKGYGTLRWDPAAGKWSITIGASATVPDVTAGYFEGSDPVALLTGKVTKWGAFTSATRVVSFGVGYTNSPPGTATTVIKSVRFQGKTYWLTCLPVKPTKPTTQPTTTAPTTAPTTTTPATTAPTTEPVTSRPTTAPTTSGSAEPSPSGSVSPSRTAGVLPTTTNVSDGSDSLPVTGPSMGLLIGIGLVLIAGGGTALVLSTRRRNSFKV